MHAGFSPCIAPFPGARWNWDNLEALAMRAFLLLATLLAFLFLVACSDIVATEPLAAQNEVTFDSGLLGMWYDSEDTTIAVTSLNRPLYEITAVDRQRQNRYLLQGRLVQFGDQRVLELVDVQPALYSIPARAWLTVERRGGGIEVRHLDSEWLKSQARRSGLSHTMIGGRMLLTAPTDRLRLFVERYGLRPEAAGDPLYLTPFPQSHTD
jgi:hypothetical protein